jgi:aldose 1-epimerase
MYTINLLPFGETYFVELKNASTGASARLLPEFGCCLHQLTLPLQNNLISLLHSETNYHDFLGNGIAAYQGALLFPFPDRVADSEYVFEGKTYRLAANDRSKKHALHGFLNQAPFVVHQQQADEQQATVVFRHEYHGQNKGYPFPCTIEVEYKLTADCLFTKTSITNSGTSVMPVGWGWHPYLLLTSDIEDYELLVPASAEYQIRNDFINFGKEIALPGNPHSVTLCKERLHCYRLQSSGNTITTVLKNRKKKFAAQLATPNNKNGYSYLQIYLPKDAPALAIEPLTCIGNAFNNGVGLIQLQSKEQLIKQFSISISA